MFLLDCHISALHGCFNWLIGYQVSWQGQSDGGWLGRRSIPTGVEFQ